MKKLEFETSKGRFLVVDIPINFLFKIHHNHLVVDSTSNGLIGKMNRLNNDPKGFIEVGRLIAKLSEISEEEASEIVDNKPSIIYDDGSISLHYRNYLYHDIQAAHIWKSSAIGSLHSLFQSKGIHLFENPLKNTLSIQSLEGSQKHSQQIKEAEQKTFYNPCIFKL